MAGLKEVRRRIASVTNTRQITRAMKLVSAAKLRRAQQAAEGGREYSQRLSRVMTNLVQDLAGEFSHPLLERADNVTLRRVVFVSGDRGLCGAFNSNVVKAVGANDIPDPVQLDFLAIGRRSVSVCRRFGWQMAGQYESLPDDAAQWPIEEMGELLMKDFEAGKCQEVVLYYTEFISAMTQRVRRQILLPFRCEDGADISDADGGSAPVEERTGYFSYNPSAKEILTRLVPVVVRTGLRQAVLESKASEHAARMTAMDNATNNADELIDKLRLHYNRARQRSITTELIDIIGGAEAIS